MFTSFNENRTDILQHPTGGVAPLRHELAVHDYLKRQTEFRQMVPATTETFWASRVFHRTMSSLNEHLSRLHIIKPLPHKLWR